MFSLIIFWEVNEFRILFLYKFELGHETHSAAEIYLKYSWNIRLDYRRYTRRKFTCGNENLENEPQDKPKSILNWTKIKGKVKADSRSDIWIKWKNWKRKIKSCDVWKLYAYRKTRNGTSPFSSRIIIRHPDNNWTLMSKPSRKKLRKRSFIKIEYIKWTLISHANDEISFSRQSSTDILIIPPYIPYQSFSTSSNVQLNELDPYFRPFHAAYHEFLPA